MVDATGSYDDLMKYMMLAQGVQSLGTMLQNNDRSQRGLQPLPGMPNMAAQYMQMAQQQKAAQQQQAAEQAILAAPGIPEGIKPLLVGNPEAQAAFIRSSMTRPDQGPKLYNTAGGLYDPTNEKWITPPAGTVPPPNPIVKPIYQGSDVVTAVIDPRSGQIMQELGRAPRWQPDTGGKGGAGGTIGSPLTGKGLAIVADESSPTGYSFLPKSEAVGKAAPPPRSMASGGLTQNQQKELTGISQEQATVQGVLDNIQKDPTAFDPLKGNALNLAGKLGEGTRSLAERKLFTPDQVQNRALLFNQVTQSIKNFAGTAQSEGESANLMRFLPSETDSPEYIAAKMRGFQQYLELKKAATPGGGGQPVALPQAPLAPRTPTLNPPAPATPAKQRIKIDVNGNIIK